MVRLKVSIDLAEKIDEACFNSIVVRLKEDRNPSCSVNAEKFQFHSGSIKSEYRDYGEAYKTYVSIP